MGYGCKSSLPNFKALSTVPCCFSDFSKSLTVIRELKDCCLFSDNFFLGFVSSVAPRGFLCNVGYTERFHIEGYLIQPWELQYLNLNRTIAFRRQVPSVEAFIKLRTELRKNASCYH